MMSHLRALVAEFPRQFWILFGGTLINSTGNGMVFPFLTLYLHQRLNLSLTYVGVILLVWSVSGLVGQFVGGALTDQFGRKRLMSTSLGTSACVLALFGFADTYATAAIVVVLAGLSNALYRPAADAMVADMIEPARRPQAYALLRVVNNLGIAIGPAIGGFLASRSYLITFLGNASATFVFFLITLFLMRETKPSDSPTETHTGRASDVFAVLRDGRFVTFCAALVLCTILAAQMMAVLPIYMKDQFGLGESYYGWVMSTNAGIVVLLQFPITRATRRFQRLFLTAAGGILYALGVFGVGFASAFPHFILAMIVYTFGEMVLVPTSTAFTADIAPAEMRGRYMGMLGLTWSVGFGIGPIIGGIIGERIGPGAIWTTIAILGVFAAIVFLALARFAPARSSRPVTT